MAKIADIAAPLSMLYHRHLAPLNACARTAHSAQTMNLISEADLDRKAAMLAVPALIKAYLRLGGVVGADAFVDHRFNTTDVCLILDTAKMNERAKSICTILIHLTGQKSLNQSSLIFRSLAGALWQSVLF